jgi:hypothetical protein
MHQITYTLSSYSFNSAVIHLTQQLNKRRTNIANELFSRITNHLEIWRLTTVLLVMIIALRNNDNSKSKLVTNRKFWTFILKIEALVNFEICKIREN